MTTAVYLIISGILMGAGISIIWRDIQKKRRGTFVSQRDARLSAEPDVEITIAHGAEPDAEVTIAHRAEPEPPPRALPPAGEQPFPLRSVAELMRSRTERQPMALNPASALHPDPVPAEGWGEGTGPAPPAHAARATGGEVDQHRQGGAHPTLEQQWLALQPAIAAGVEKTNAVLAAVRLFIGPVGEPSWSYKNKGYGAYRRLLMAGESVAWLRLELLVDGQLRVSVKAHKEDRASVNAVADMPAAGLDAARAADLFSGCLQSAALYAAGQTRDSDEEASEQAWESIDALVAAALKATNGVLAQTGARLIALAPAAWERDLRRHRMAVTVEVNGDDVARMHIERLPYEMEVAVGVREPQLADLGRRRRIPVDGITIHALAEVIASCAWPAIARFRETRRQA
jgi:hypothetical protein